LRPDHGVARRPETERADNACAGQEWC
jgi:hypothetical protein